MARINETEDDMTIDVRPPTLAATRWFSLENVRSANSGAWNWHRIDHGACYYKTTSRRSLMMVACCGSECAYGGSRRKVDEPLHDHCWLCDSLHDTWLRRERYTLSAEVMA